MPKSKNRKNHKQKVGHQRMLDKHRQEKLQKEQKRQYEAFEKMIAEQRQNIAQRRADYVKNLAENEAPNESQMMTKSLTEAIIIESADAE